MEQTLSPCHEYLSGPAGCLIEPAFAAPVVNGRTALPMSGDSSAFGTAGVPPTDTRPARKPGAGQVFTGGVTIDEIRP